VRWHDPPVAPAAAAAHDDDDIEVTDVADGSLRFEFVLLSYWADVTAMTLQCALTVCSSGMPASADDTSAVCT